MGARVPAGRPQARADRRARLQAHVTPGGLAQVIATLLDNALMHGGGTVTIQTSQNARSVVIEVRDEGNGIPADLVPRIFERSVSGRPEGTGLGLALARTMAAADGGRVVLVKPKPPPSRSSCPATRPAPAPSPSAAPPEPVARAGAPVPRGWPCCKAEPRGEVGRRASCAVGCNTTGEGRPRVRRDQCIDAGPGSAASASGPRVGAAS